MVTLLPAERLIHLILGLSLTIFIIGLLLVAFVIGRRVKRDRDFKVLDHFRKQAQAILRGLFDHTLEYEEALRKFQSLIKPRYRRAMEQILIEESTNPELETPLRRLAEDLGFVRIWQNRVQRSHRQAPSRRRRFWEDTVRRIRFLRFLTAARSAENLGRIRHHKSWELLVQALHHHHRDVQTVALRSLASIGEPQSFPALVRQLRAAVAAQKPRLSEHALKSALSRFPLNVAGQLLPLLQDSNPRLRTLALQILREMLAGEAARQKRALLAANLSFDLFDGALLQLIEDENADVRAAAADVLTFLKDERAGQALLKLSQDVEWFVRLHAVRALGEKGNSDSAPLLAKQLTDSHWRVREAAAHALMRCGEAGREQLLSSFLRTQDAYAQEQIAEELQISGVISELIERCSEKDAMQELELIRKMIKIGKTSHIESLLCEQIDPPGREIILAELARDPDLQVQIWVAHLNNRCGTT
jgi:HEAT repeat protein